VPDREEVKEDLKTETDSVDLGEVVGAVTKGSTEVGLSSSTRPVLNSSLAVIKPNFNEKNVTK